MEESLKPKTPISAAESSLKPKATQTSAESSLKPKATQTSAESSLKPKATQTSGESSLKPKETQTSAESSLKPKVTTGAAESSLKPKVRTDESQPKQETRQPKPGTGHATPMQDNRANRVDEKARLDGQTIQIDDKTYKVVKLISEKSSEAQIYLVEAGGKKYAFKHYYTDMPLAAENIEILSRVSRLSGMKPSLIVPVYCFGQYSQSQRRFVSMHKGDKPQGSSRCFELMAYGEGDNLDKYCIRGDQKRFREMAIMLAAGIDLLHKKQILHRDIKPANCFFLDKEKTMPVITDFGLASICKADGTLETTQYNNSPIFAAPEMYVTPPGEDAVYRISTKSDFYALGLVLISIWMGHDRFINEFVGNDDITFRGLKTKGKLNLPDDLDDRNRSLLLALLDNDDQTRASFEEIAQWAEGKTNPFAARLGVKKEVEEDAFRIVFDRTNNIVAHSLEDLAHMLLAKQTFGRDYIYNGYLLQEFKRLKRPELASLVTQVTERFPKDKAAGLFTLAMKLDPNVPYIDVKGKEMVGLKDIAKTLIRNFDTYLKNLTNSLDYLYLYINAHGGRAQAEKLLKGMQKTGSRRSALQRFITEIDPDAPFRIVTADGNVRLCYNVDAVIDVWSVGFSDESWDDLVGDGFEAWLSVNNPTALSRFVAAHERMESYLNYNDNVSLQRMMLYNLNPEQCDYSGSMDANDENRCFTLEQVCIQLNIWLVGYDTHDKDSELFKICDRRLDDLALFKGRQLHIYLDSKLKYQKQIDLLLKLTDVNSAENKSKYAPNNWKICCYKALRAVGHKPFYIFRGRQNQIITTLDDLKNIPDKEKKDALANWGLGNWLATFFHEDPTKRFAKKYDYEREVVKYLDMIGAIDPTNKTYSRYMKARLSVKANSLSVKAAHKVVVAAKVVSGIAIGILLIAAIGLAVWGIPLGGWNPLLTIAAPVGISIAIITFILSWILGINFGCLGQLIVSALVGVIFGGALWAIGMYGLPYLGYAVASILFAYALFIAYKTFIAYRKKLVCTSEMTSPGFEHLCLEPLHYTFKEKENKRFDSSLEDQCMSYVGDSKVISHGIFKRSIVGGALGLLVCIGYYGFSPAFNEKVNAYVVHKGAEQAALTDSIPTVSSEPVKEEVKPKAKKKKSKASKNATQQSEVKNNEQAESPKVETAGEASVETAAEPTTEPTAEPNAEQAAASNQLSECYSY